jgi:hypothetical protein
MHGNATLSSRDELKLPMREAASQVIFRPGKSD